MEYRLPYRYFKNERKKNNFSSGVFFLNQFFKKLFKYDFHYVGRVCGYELELGENDCLQEWNGSSTTREASTSIGFEIHSHRKHYCKVDYFCLLYQLEMTF